MKANLSLYKLWRRIVGVGIGCIDHSFLIWALDVRRKTCPIIIVAHTAHHIPKVIPYNGTSGIWNYLPTSSCHSAYLRSSFSKAVPCVPIQRIPLTLSPRISVRLTSRLHLVLRLRKCGALPTFMAQYINTNTILSFNVLTFPNNWSDFKPINQ
jgi:hypothetical protein